MTLPPSAPNTQRDYWNAIAGAYQKETTISVKDFHYGPLLPGDGELKLLPPDVDELRALELGSGAGQNSIYLASQGARCTAVDVSEEQIAVGEKLAVKRGVTVDFHAAALEEVNPDELGTFDLVHSVFALPFVSDPAGVICRAADCLAKDGTFVLSTVHPLFPCEWLELDGEGYGLFVSDYYRPPVELEQGRDGNVITSHAYPVSTICEWLHDTNLAVTRLLEPRPLPLNEMSAAEIHQRVPYYSPAWHEQYQKIVQIPVALVLVCRYDC